MDFSDRAQTPAQPAPRGAPVLLHGGRGGVDRFGDLLDRHAGEEAQLDNARAARVRLGELGERHVQFDDERDAEDAKYKMEGETLDGRRINIEWAQGGRKSSDQMRSREQGGRGGGGGGGGGYGGGGGGRY